MLQEASERFTSGITPISSFSEAQMKNTSLRKHATTVTAFFCFSTLLAGCTHFQEMEKPVSFKNEIVRTCQDTVNAKGRFSIQYHTGHKKESLHGKFDWKQTLDYTVITLFSPLGQTVARIEVSPEMTTFVSPGHSPRSADNAEELIRTELGWTLPVSGLRDWLQGCATDMQGHAFVATPVSKQVITNDGWQINYVTWSEESSVPLPKRIDLTKGSHDTRDVDIQLKLVIDEWDF